MPTFENGWICRECWSANRQQDERCYRCHAVPKRREMPEPITFSTPEGKPNEERKKVSSLTGPQVARVAEASPPQPAAPRIPLSERLRGLVIVAWVRAAIAGVKGTFGRVMSVGRVVVGAPGAGARRVSQAGREAKNKVSSGATSVLSHRRVWLSVAWVISAITCALLFSVALNAQLAASLVVVASVAIFSGLSAAIATNTSERQSQRLAEHHDKQVTIGADHPAQPAEILGSRPAH